MALPLTSKCPQILRFSRCLNGSNHVLRSVHVSPIVHKSRPLYVCKAPDENMIMCWHPEPEFPYEHTQALPRDRTELTQGDSALKVQYLLDEKLKHRPDGPTDNELSQLFHTKRIHWYPRPVYDKKVRQRKYNPKDRDGL